MTTAPIRRMPQGEFIVMMAMLFATIAFSIDSMLPGLPAIAAELTPQDPNRAQLILTSFVLGMGLGTFVMGPLSDAFGRKTVLLSGSALYCMAAVACHFAPSLELLLIARVVAGLGAAGPRIVSMALVRDLYKGREMARIVSTAMMVFAMVPAVAPLLGSFIIAGFGWRAVFIAFILFALISGGWLALRQPETLPTGARRPLSFAVLWASLVEVLGNRLVVVTIAVQSCVFAMLFSNISSIQQIFEQVFGKAGSFPWWFAAIAVISSTGSFVNGRLVVALGMRLLVSRTLWALFALSLVVTGLWSAGLVPPALAFPVYMVWVVACFFSNGFTLGNLNAMAMEPMGHMAGFTASAVGSIATVLSVLIAAPVGLAFDGTPLPLMAGCTALILAAALLMRLVPRRQG